VDDVAQTVQDPEVFISSVGDAQRALNIAESELAIVYIKDTGAQGGSLAESNNFGFTNESKLNMLSQGMSIDYFMGPNQASDFGRVFYEIFAEAEMEKG